jgi:hypothetical protein
LLTGIDLEKYGEEGTVIEASHYDHNFLTIHDSSTFSRYNIWSRNGEKIEVDVPRGCFLIMAGKQVSNLQFETLFILFFLNLSFFSFSDQIHITTTL